MPIRSSRLVVVFVIAAVSLLADAASAQGKKQTIERTIDLFVGEQTVVPAAGVDKYSEGTPGIVDIRLPDDAAEFVIVARRAGTTTMLLLMNDGSRIRYTFIVRLVRVTERDNIRLDFYFVELTRNEQLRFGIGWPGTIGGTANLGVSYDFKGGSTTAATASLATQVLPRLDFGQNTGWAKILREASVVTANGEASSFQSGGEVNFRVEGNNSSSVQPITFGSTVQVKPRYDRTTSRLDIEITANVAELTSASAEGLPGRSTTSLATTVNLGLGQSIVLAGLHSKSEGNQRDGLPYLSQIPVLGYLFGARQIRAEETENVIFIVPTILQAVPLEERDRVAEALAIYRGTEGNVTGNRIYRRNFPKPTESGAPAPAPAPSTK